MSDDDERAEALFGDRSQYFEGVGVVFPAYNDEAIRLLKTDPAEYFRLSRLWAGYDKLPTASTPLLMSASRFWSILTIGLLLGFALGLIAWTQVLP